MLLALGAEVTLVSADGERDDRRSRSLRDDGIEYLTKRPDEILTAVHLPPHDGLARVYWKLRRRGSFDFPVLSVAAAVAARGDDGAVEGAHRPRRRRLAAAGRRRRRRAPGRPSALTDEAIAAAADAAARVAKPLDNTDFDLGWRKRVTRDFVTAALRELRGDDMREWRRKLSRLIL